MYFEKKELFYTDLITDAINLTKNKLRELKIIIYDLIADDNDKTMIIHKYKEMALKISKEIYKTNTGNRVFEIDFVKRDKEIKEIVKTLRDNLPIIKVSDELSEINTALNKSVNEDVSSFKNTINQTTSVY